MMKKEQITRGGVVSTVVTGLLLWVGAHVMLWYFGFRVPEHDTHQPPNMSGATWNVSDPLAQQEGGLREYAMLDTEQESGLRSYDPAKIPGTIIKPRPTNTSMEVAR